MIRSVVIYLCRLVVNFKNTSSLYSIMTIKKGRKQPLGANGKDTNSVLIICAHSDDQVFGPGGTVAKYAKEGKRVHTIIFSYGEKGMPIHNREYAVRTR